MTYVLYNPLSNNHAGLSDANRLSQLLPLEKLQYEDVTKLDVSAFLKETPVEDKIILAGGDGTLTHFARVVAKDGLHRKIWYYPAGSGNDFYADVREKEEELPMLLNPYIEKLPTVTVNGKPLPFLNGIGYGIDGYCCEEGDKLREKAEKKINYTSIAIQGLLFHFKPRTAQVTVDGVTETFRHVWLAPVMHGRYYGGGMDIAPDQNRCSGSHELSLVVLHCPSKLKTLVVFPSIFQGKHVAHREMVSVFTGKEISVRFDRPTPLQIDGETVSGVTEFSASAYTPAKVSEKAEATV